MKKKLLLQDIMDYISQSERLTPKDADTFVRSFFDIVEQGLLEDKIVKIKGLGTFKLVSVSERESVNINTGERIQIEGHTKISFTPDSSMKELVNRPFAHFESVELSDETNAEDLDKIGWNNSQENEDPEDDTDDEDDVAESDDNAEEEEEYNDNSEEEVTDSNATAGKDLDRLNAQSEPDFSIELASEPCPPEPDDNTDNPKMTETDATLDASARPDAEASALSAPIELDKITPNSIQTHEPLNGGIPHPTIIAPPDLAECDAQRETAKVKIDSNEDEGEADEPIKDSATKETADSAESIEVSEEEIIVTSPRPITSEHTSTHTSNTMGYAYVEIPPRRKINWWKRGVLILLFALSLIASYFAGYYRLLCPCIFMSNDYEGTAFTQSPDFETPASVEQSLRSVPATQISTEPHDTATDTSSDSQKENPGISSTITTEPSESTPRSSNNKTNLQSTKVEESNPKRKAAQQTQSILSSQTSDKPAIQNQNTTLTQQRPKTHRVKVGDTLYKIARQYYGSEKAVEKIIKYNHLPNADYIQSGMELQLP